MSDTGDQEDARQLRKRQAKNLSEDDQRIDALLGIDARGKTLRSARPDVALLRRKVERSCPATSFSRAVAPAAVLPTLLAEGFRAPLVVRASAAGGAAATRAALGIRLPPKAMSPRGMVSAVGPDVEVPTFDVATQDSGPRMTVRQLADYFDLAPEARGRLINVVSFSLADTRLAAAVDAPEAARRLDLASQVWPQPRGAPSPSPSKQRGKGGGDGAAPPRRPETLLYALMGPQGAYTDWHVDMGGSAVWYHVVSGAKIFLAAPNTPKNAAAYETWSSSARQASTFLGDGLEGCVRITLRAGDTLFLPGGWPHAVATPEDSFVLGGNFLHALDYATVAAVLRAERRMGVGPRFQFPAWQELLWRAAADAAARARAPAPAPAGPAAGAAKSPRRQAAAAAGERQELSRWEREGLPSLVRLLRSGAAAAEAPEEIDDPEGLLEELERAFGAAKGPSGAGKGAKKRARRPSTSDCGSSDEGGEEGRGLAPTRDPRLPEKRAKQAATLEQLRAARASKQQRPILLDSDEEEEPDSPASSPSDSSLDIDLGFESSEEEGEEGRGGPAAGAGPRQAPAPLGVQADSRDTPTKSRDPQLRLPGAPAPAAAARVKLADRAGKVRQKPALLPVPADAKPPGRRAGAAAGAASEQASGSVAAGGGAGDNGPRAAALRAIAALRRAEAELCRDERLLAGVASGLKDAGQKLAARVAAGRARVDALAAQLEGRVIFFVDGEGRRQGPFTSRQLGALVQAGRCPGDGMVQRAGPDGGSQELTVAEAVALPEPESAVALREERERAAAAAAEAAAAATAAAAAAAAEVYTPSQEFDQPRGKKERSARKDAHAKGRDRKKGGGRPGPQESGAPAESPRGSKRQSRWEDRPPSGASTAAAPRPGGPRAPRPGGGAARPSGPSAWSIAAAAADAMAAQESAAVWAYKEPGSGRLAGPCSTAELRAAFAAGELTQDVMVHDEEEGCSISLYALLGVARGGGQAEAPPPKPVAAEEPMPPAPPPAEPMAAQEAAPPPPPPPPPPAAAPPAPPQESWPERDVPAAPFDIQGHPQAFAYAPEQYMQPQSAGNGYGGGYFPPQPAPAPLLPPRPQHAPPEDFGQYRAPAPAPYPYQQMPPPPQQPVYQQQPTWGPPPGPPPPAPPPHQPSWPGQQQHYPPPPAHMHPPPQYAPPYAPPPPQQGWAPAPGPPEHRPMMRAAPQPPQPQPPMMQGYGPPPPQQSPYFHEQHPQGPGPGAGFPPPPSGAPYPPPQQQQYPQQQPYYPQQHQYDGPPPQHRGGNGAPRGRGGRHRQRY